MKLLTFLARHFEWTPFSKTLPEALDDLQPDSMEDTVVVFMHIETKDVDEEHSADEVKRVFRHTLKHIKWLANKKGYQNVVLHSFAHLGGESAAPESAELWMQTLRERLEKTGYQVKITPFGWFCSWNIDVLGESLAKVWKSI